MAFFPEDPLDAQLRGWGQRLYKLYGRAATKASDEEFRLLRNAQGAMIVELVLSWYEKHHLDDFCPQCHSAQMFRRKFGQLVAAAQRAPDAEVKMGSRNLQALYEAQALRDWPPEVAGQIENIISSTDAHWQKYKALMRARADKAPHTREARFLYTVLELYAPRFVEMWMDLLYLNLQSKEHYTGPVHTLSFTPGRERFLYSCWRHWAQSWSRWPKTFDLLYNDLYEEWKSGK